MSSNPRIKELDGLRGLAIIWVLISHLTSRFGELYEYSSPPLFQLPRGTLGVELFFMISGFVIFMTLERTKDFRSFVINRAARLYPAFLVCAPLTFLIVTAFGLPDREVGIYDAAANLTFIPTILGYKFIDGAYWSLEIEVVFYAVASFAFFLIGRKAAFAAIAVLVFANMLIYLLEMGSLKDSFILSKVLKIRSMHFFLIGVAYYNLKKAPVINFLTIMMGCFCSSLEYGLTGWLLTILISIIFGIGACHGSRFLLAKPLIFFGYISYPLYLIHQNISYVIIRSAQETIGTNPAILMAGAASILLAVLVTYLIEKPLMLKIKTIFLEKRKS